MLEMYKEDPEMLEVFGLPVEPGKPVDMHKKEIDLVILSSLAAETLIHDLNKPKEQALMASYEEALIEEQKRKAAMLVYVPPPPPPAVTETVITEEKKLELEAQGIEVEAGVTLTLCDETGLPANQTDTFSNTMDPPPAREIASALEDQFGARGGFELFNASSSGLKYPFLECKASNGCFAQSDKDSQKEHLLTLDEVRNEMDVGFDAGFKAMNNLAKSVEIIGAPSMRIFGTGIACFSRTTQACRLLQPASAEDAFAACFQDGHVATAERVSMDKLVAGDTVLANAATLTRVVVNQHATVKAAAPMLTLHFEGGSLSLTADHVLQLDGTLSPAPRGGRLRTVVWPQGVCRHAQLGGGHQPDHRSRHRPCRRPDRRARRGGDGQRVARRRAPLCVSEIHALLQPRDSVPRVRAGVLQFLARAFLLPRRPAPRAGQGRRADARGCRRLRRVRPRQGCRCGSGNRGRRSSLRQGVRSVL